MQVLPLQNDDKYDIIQKKNKGEIYMEKKLDLDKQKEWLKENLVGKEQASIITGQSLRAFNQSVYRGLIEPFFEIEGNTRTNVRLYLKSDLETYKANKRK